MAPKPATVKVTRLRAPSTPSRLTAFAVGVLTGLSIVAFDDRRPQPPIPETLEKKEGADSAGLVAVLRKTWSDFNEDQIPAVAASATFFCLLALFPALGVFASLYGLFADVTEARSYILDLQGVLPGGAITVLTDQLDRLARTPHVRLGWTFAISFLLSIWSANAGMKSLIAGLNVAYEVKEHRNFFTLNAISLCLTLGLILVALAVAAFLAWLTVIGLTKSPLALAIQWVVLMGVIFLGLSVLYSYGPCRPHAGWRCITPGSAFAAVTWLIMSLLFTLYVANFGHYDKTYGTLGAIVGFMTWIWLSLCVVLLSAELNSNVH